MNTKAAGYLIFVMDGKSEKLFAAALISTMLAASGLMLPCWLKARKPETTGT